MKKLLSSRLLFFGLAAFLLAAEPLVAEDAPPIPAAFPSSRYAPLLEKSPFAVATAPPEVVAPAENFATNWIVTGLSKSKTPEGAVSYTVFVRSRDLTTRLVLSGNTPSPEGVSIVSVDEAPVAAKSIVTLKKGEEIGKVGFDMATVSAAASVPQPAVPNASGKPGQQPPRPPASKIPRPTMSSQARSSAPSAPSPSGTQSRGRVRAVEEAP